MEKPMFKTKTNILKTENLDAIADRIFSEAFNTFSYPVSSPPWSKVNTEGTETTIKVALPGVRKDLVDIEVEDVDHGGKCTISVGPDAEYEGPVNLPLERYVNFSKPLDLEKVDASLKDGILTVVVRARDEPKPNSKKVRLK